MCDSEMSDLASQEWKSAESYFLKKAEQPSQKPLRGRETSGSSGGIRKPWRQEDPYLFRVSAVSRTYEGERTVTVTDLGRREVQHSVRKEKSD